MNPHEMNEVIKRLRNGEKVLCHHCKKGILKQNGITRHHQDFNAITVKQE